MHPELIRTDLAGCLGFSLDMPSGISRHGYGVLLESTSRRHGTQLLPGNMLVWVTALGNASSLDETAYP